MLLNNMGKIKSNNTNGITVEFRISFRKDSSSFGNLITDTVLWEDVNIIPKTGEYFRYFHENTNTYYKLKITEVIWLNKNNVRCNTEK